MENSCLNCGWDDGEVKSKTIGVCSWMLKIKVPRAFYYKYNVYNKKLPYTNCPCWKQKEATDGIEQANKII